MKKFITAIAITLSTVSTVSAKDWNCKLGTKRVSGDCIEVRSSVIGSTYLHNVCNVPLVVRWCRVGQDRDCTRNGGASSSWTINPGKKFSASTRGRVLSIACR